MTEQTTDTNLELDENIQIDRHYYIVGLTKNGASANVEIVFPFLESDVKAAVMEGVQFNTMAPEERENFQMESMEKFAQAYLVATYKTRSSEMFFCLHASDEEKNKEQLQAYINGLDFDHMYSKRMDL